MRTLAVLPLLLGLWSASQPANALGVYDDRACAETQCQSQFKKLFKHARNGNPEAQYLVAVALLNGDGMQQDTDRGLLYLKKSARDGYAKSLWRLATIYREGYWVKKDAKRAASYLDRAAKKGFGPALFQKATSVIDFNAARTTPDNTKALAWLQTAVDNRYPQAMYFLAKMHQTNTLVQQDLYLAADLFNRLSQTGYRDSRQRLDQILTQGQQQPELQARLDTLNTDIEVINVGGLNWNFDTALDTLVLQMDKDPWYNGMAPTGTRIKGQSFCNGKGSNCKAIMTVTEYRHWYNW